MALRMTRRDTYGGERGWQDGAGVSWTSLEGGGKQQWRAREPIEAENPPHDGTDDDSHRTGVFNRIAVGLGLRRPGPKGYQRSDERIREDICEHLWHEHHLDVSEVSVEVDQRVVRLEGTVPHRQMKHRIEDIAASCGGVEDVENRIRVVRTG
jgi:osmotically-inducible protein OsmY